MFGLFFLTVSLIYALFLGGLMAWTAFVAIFRQASRISNKIDYRTSIFTQFHQLLNRHNKSFVVGSLLMSILITAYQFAPSDFFSDKSLICEVSSSDESNILICPTETVAANVQIYNDYSFTSVDVSASPPVGLAQAILSTAHDPNYHLSLYDSYQWQAEILLSPAGEVIQTRIHKGISQGLDRQILNLIQENNYWKPAYKNQEPVAQRLLFSIDLSH